MSTHHLKAESITVVITGIGFLNYARKYYDAAEVLRKESDESQYDPLQYHLLCQSLELNLKAFIWLMDRPGTNRFKDYYRHKLVKLWEDAKTKGIRRYCTATPLRDRIIALVGPYYKDRQFVYLDAEMVGGGIGRLHRNKRILPTLRTLCERLLLKLKADVYYASEE